MTSETKEPRDEELIQEALKFYRPRSRAHFHTRIREEIERSERCDSSRSIATAPPSEVRKQAFEEAAKHIRIYDSEGFTESCSACNWKPSWEKNSANTDHQWSAHIAALAEARGAPPATGAE